MADDKTTSNWKGFHDRYEADPAFKKSVDDRRTRSDAKKHTESLTEILRMTQGASGSRKKAY